MQNEPVKFYNTFIAFASIAGADSTNNYFNYIPKQLDYFIYSLFL